MRLTKHHGLGNDFLVLSDYADEHPIDADMARALCDRHRGVGADGLLRVTAPTAGRVTMELRNEDGSRAEMSGNGISCLAQAVVRAGRGQMASGGTVQVVVDTDAGERTVSVVAAPSDTEHHMRVDMGVPQLGAPAPEWVTGPTTAATTVDMGNPHLVCRVAAPITTAELVALGERANAAIDGGTNVEVITVDADGGVHMQVYERGVGPTWACGTGAVAAATAARHWGLSGAQVTVHQPGGAAVVDLGAGSGSARLTVPVVVVAEIDWLR